MLTKEEVTKYYEVLEEVHDIALNCSEAKYPHSNTEGIRSSQIASIIIYLIKVGIIPKADTTSKTEEVVDIDKRNLISIENHQYTSIEINSDSIDQFDKEFDSLFNRNSFKQSIIKGFLGEVFGHNVNANDDVPIGKMRLKKEK